MSTTAQIAKHLREVHFGGNWTWSNLKDQLSDVTWEESLVKIGSLNTIATLSYHISYYVTAILGVLKNEPMNAKDEYSFTHPPIQSQQDWTRFLDSCWKNAEECAVLIEQLPDSILEETFVDPKYGIYYRNFHGLIEHSHYHLGQIAMIKKLIREKTN